MAWPEGFPESQSDERLMQSVRRVRGPDVPARSLLDIAYPLLDRIAVFVVPEAGARVIYSAGDEAPFAARPLQVTNPTFPVPLDGPVTVLLRLETSGSLQFALSLWTPAAFAGSLSLRALAYGFYYGVFAVLILLSFSAYPYFRVRVFLLYGAYLLSYVLLQAGLNGLLYRFMVPDGGVWGCGNRRPHAGPGPLQAHQR
jgi:diguanylate cyclase